MADNDVLLTKVFDAIENLNKIKNLVEKTDLKTTNILESLNRQESIINGHIIDIAFIRNEIEHIKKNIRNMKIDIENYEYHNNNIYYKLRQIEIKENRYRQLKLKITNAFKTIIANKYTIALITSLILATMFFIAKLLITYTGNYFGIEKNIIDLFHNELNNNK